VRLTVNRDFNKFWDSWRDAIGRDTHIAPHVQSAYPSELQSIPFPFYNYRAHKSKIYELFVVWFKYNKESF